MLSLTNNDYCHRQLEIVKDLLISIILPLTYCLTAAEITFIIHV